MAEAGVNFLYLDCIEIEMLPGPAAGGSHRWSVDPEWVDNEPQEQRTLAAEFVAEFMREAYREPVSESRITQKMELFDALRKSGYSFEDSLRETLTAVLVSPSFLFLEPKQPEAEARQAGEPTAHQRACRLSYFLWQAPPDDRLRQLADDGSLLKHDVYTSEAERLLDDSRTRRFLDDFCRQWLRLDKHQNVAVNPDRYPDYDDDLAKTTIRETLDYVAEVFASGVSAVDLLDSGYALLNDRLADHYGLDPIPSGDLRRVSLPGDSIRGGLLTQASVLTMNSDGRDSHPVRRGVWLLERLLTTPPPPPPPNVPDLDREDPDLRGLSLKEQLELHREPSSCRSCHRQIDPWGIALENFDATGQWREAVRAGGSTTPVDAAVTLPGGKQIDGVHDFKQVLMEQHREQFTTALTHHMLTYALGRSLDHADRKHVEAIHRRFAAADYRLKELVSAVVDNEAFRQ
jgi:hypothetical protein